MSTATLANPTVAKPTAGKPVPAEAETTHDILHLRTHPLDVFFRPKSVAVIGATETASSVGRTVLWNLVSSPFGGTVFPVNPKWASILGIKAYPNIGAVPESVDLAVVVTPAATVPGIIGECADAGVKGAVVISGEFREIGQAGEELEKQILDHARRARMRVIGPNCLGVMSPLTGLNATFANCIARPGSVGFISQSGALCTAVLDWSMREIVGFSAFLSIGSMVDVGWGDLIDYLGDDPRTRSIVIYMESPPASSTPMRCETQAGTGSWPPVPSLDCGPWSFGGGLPNPPTGQQARASRRLPDKRRAALAGPTER